MKVYEILKETSAPIKGGMIWNLIKTTELSRPVMTAWNNIQAAQQSGASADDLVKIKENELAKCSASLGAMVIGGNLIKTILGSMTKSSKILAAISGLGQLALMQWINTAAGQAVIGKWLTGEVFTGFGIIDNAGPLFQEYAGPALKTLADTSVNAIKSDTVSNAISGATDLATNAASQLVPNNVKDAMSQLTDPADTAALHDKTNTTGVGIPNGVPFGKDTKSDSSDPNRPYNVTWR